MHTTDKNTGPKERGYKPAAVYPASDINGRGTIIEVGPGKGEFLFHLAAKHPDKIVCGIEIKGRRFDKLIQGREKRRLSNLRLVMADASQIMPELFPDGSAEAIYVNFPDPWPKRRHEPHRLLSPAFLRECARVLAKGGVLSITTDFEEYARKTFKEACLVPGLTPAPEGLTTESDEAYPTHFSERWRKEGRTIYYQRFIRLQK